MSPTTASQAIDETRPASANYHANALARGIGLMERLADSPRPLTLADFHTSTQLPKSTLVRLLAVLVELEFLVRVDDQPSYRLGHKVQVLSRAYENSLDIHDVAGGPMAATAEEVGHTCNLGVLDGDRVLHLCVEEPNRPLRFNSVAGSRDLAYCTGLGKLLLSALEPEQVAQLMPQDPWEKHTESTITTLDGLTAELQKIRQRGYALDDNERSPGLKCVAVGIMINNTTPAAVSLSGPAAEFTAAQQKLYVARLTSLAEQLAADPDFVVTITRLTSGLRS